MSTIYKITIKDFKDHNAKYKKSFKYAMISHNFCDHSSVRALPLAIAWLYLQLILTAAEMSPEGNRGTFKLHSKSLQGMIRGKLKGQYALDQLQSYQLLTYEKNESLIELNKKKKNKIEKKENSVNGTKVEKQKPTQVEFVDANASPPVESTNGKSLVAFYCDVWKRRYKSNPPIRPQDAKILKQVGESSGFDRTKILLDAYLRMNEKWFLQKRHDLATFLNNLTSVAHFVETGRVITGQDLRNVDRAIANKNTLDALEKGEI